MNKDSQSIPAASYCQECSGEIYPGELRYFWDGKWVCPDCFQSHVERQLRDFPAQLADEMGVRYEHL